MIKNKIDLIAALKEVGITSYSNRKERIFGEQEMQNMRSGKVPSKGVLNKLCRVLNCQPGDLMEYVPDEEIAEPTTIQQVAGSKMTFNDSIK